MLGTITITVGQRESEDVREKDPDKEMAAKSAVAEDLAKDGQEETPEMLEQIPTSDSSNLEDGAQPAEPQANDVGFKKVFKFVGFKFTVKKDKTEKSDTVQLLTVKKDEDEGTEGSIGAGDHPEPGVESGEPAARGEGEPQPCAEGPGDTPKPERGHADTPVQAESTAPVTEHVKEEEGEEKREQREPAKSPDSPSSPVPNDTASPFKKFFTQGWAGWRKKTSFRKPKEDELEASEKKEPEPGKGDAEERGTTEGSAAGRAPPAEPEPERAEERAEQTRLSADYEKVELPEEDGAGAPGERCAPLASEVFDEKIEVQQEVVAEVHVSTGEGEEEEEEEEAEQEKPEEEPRARVEATVMDASSPEEEKPAGAPEDAHEPAGDHAQPTDPGADDKELPKHPEGLVSEVDMLSSQERVKVQGSPLKKLFSSSGLKKLSAKKQKGKRGGGDEEPGEHPPDSPEEPKGESSASSPEEPEEITCLEKGIGEGAPEGDVEEGATSDGEKKREGITPWASFKKMVTPKKRVRRPSESDKEEELDKVKSATLSSTESAASDAQEEGKGAGEEQKPEEAKRRVDTSVSWEALICVGSSKKRARKASSSDDEGGPRTAGEGQGHKGGEDKEMGAEAIPACSPEQDHGQGSSSPEPAGSPSEGEGVSTWESFKRLVTPRKKSKTKVEEKMEDPAGDHLAGDAEPCREESWVSIKKLIPGRRKKRSDGKQEPAAVEDTGPSEATNEEDSEVPAVVPLSEYDAVEREKLEARESAEPSVPVYVSEELSKTLVHTVSVAVIDGARAVSGVEERSPSWISTSVTEPLEPAEDEATPLTEGVTERDVLIVEEAPAATHEDTAAVSEVELTSEAVTAAETSEALGPEEVTEASGADMVSAVSQLTDSRDTTEEATPVQEVEGGVPDVEEQERRTQAVLQAVAEKVKEGSGPPGASGPDDAVPAVATQKAGPKVLERVEETEEYSEALGPEKQSADDEALKVPGQETDAEHVTQGSVVVQTTEVPEAAASLASEELTTTLQAEALGVVKSQHQAMPPDSSETLTDSETNGSTPVADLEDGALESHDDMTVATSPPSQVTETEAAPAQKEGPPAPPAGQSQKEDEPRTDVLEHTEQESPVEAVAPVACKTRAVQEEGQFADGGVQGVPCVEGPAASAPLEGTGSAEKMAEVVLDGEVSGGAECPKRENVELQSPSPEERGMGADVEGEEKPEAKRQQASDEPEISQQLVQVVGHLEGSRPHTEQPTGACTEAQVQSSCLAEKVLETAKIAETGETLPSAGAHLSTAEKSSEEDEDGTPQPRGPATPVGPESHTESMSLIASATPEDAPPSEWEEERSTPQKPRSPEDEEQMGAQEGGASAAREGDLQAEHEILELVTESSKLVQNIIQTAVDQVARTEGRVPETTTPDLAMPTPLTQADHQGAGQMQQEEDSGHPACTQDETWPSPAQDASQPDPGTPTLPDTSKDDIGPSEHTVTVEVESSLANDQQFEEVIVASETERNGIEPDAPSKLEERVKKPPLEPKEDAKEGAAAAVGPQHQSPALADADTLGGLTKESPDTNGPKLTEDGDAEEGLQGGKAPSKLDKDSQPQTEGDLPKQEGDAARSELTES